MRVLTISNCPLIETQGSGYIITNFCERLRERGHQVDAFGPDTYEPLKFLRGKAKGHRLTLGMFLATLRQLGKETYDIVEFYGANSWLIASFLRRNKNRKFMMVSHSNGLETQYAEELESYLGPVSPISGRPLKWYQRSGRSQSEKAFTQVDRLVTVSECNAEYARSKHYLPSESIVAIENSLSEDFIGLPVKFERPPVIGYCGSWMANKGSKIIVEDIGKLLATHPHSTFRLIGVGTGFSKKACFPVGVCSRVEVVPFTHSKEELKQHYQGLSILVLPSVYEGFGLVGAEGMACGCALVASRTGFAAGLKHGEEAMLMSEPRSPHLYNSVKALLTDDRLRVKVAQEGYRRVQSLRWETAVDKLERAYSQWLIEFKPNPVMREIAHLDNS